MADVCPSDVSFSPCLISLTPSSGNNSAKPARIQAGDTVGVHFQVIEGQRRRVQVFEGVILKRQGSGSRETFTVRKQSSGVGVERTFPLHSPKIEKIDVKAIGDVRRAKLYYCATESEKRPRVRELPSSWRLCSTPCSARVDVSSHLTDA